MKPGGRPVRTAALALALLPGVGSHDPRTTGDPRHAPWQAVALLQIPGVSRCTAVMVAPTLAATAAHCLWNKALGRVVPTASIHLLLGYDAGTFVRHIIPDAVTFATGADPANHQPRGTDLALLHVSPGVLDVVAVVAAPLEPGTPLMLGGFGQDRAERLAVDPGCAARGYGRGTDAAPLLLHDCNGTRGSSGGALLMRDGAGWALAGIQVAAEREGAGGDAIPGFTVARLIADATRGGRPGE